MARAIIRKLHVALWPKRLDTLTYNIDTVDLLGYRIKAGTLQPDPERVKTLQELTPPKNHKEL